jgi:hypothetical protein
MVVHRSSALHREFNFADFRTSAAGGLRLQSGGDLPTPTPTSPPPDFLAQKLRGILFIFFERKTYARVPREARFVQVEIPLAHSYKLLIDERDRTEIIESLACFIEWRSPRNNTSRTSTSLPNNPIPHGFHASRKGARFAEDPSR